MTNLAPSTIAALTVVLLATARSGWAAHRRSVAHKLVLDRPESAHPVSTRNSVKPRRHKNDPNSELLEVLALIGRNLEAGASLATAIAESLAVASHGSVLAGLQRVDEQSPQTGLIIALRRWGDEDPLCRRTAWALAVAAETGGNPLAAIDALTDSLRSERALQRELGALTAQSRLSAAVLGIVPIGFGVLMSGTDPKARHFLLATAPGRACLVVGLTFDALAWWWLRSIGSVTT